MSLPTTASSKLAERDNGHDGYAANDINGHLHAAVGGFYAVLRNQALVVRRGKDGSDIESRPRRRPVTRCVCRLAPAVPVPSSRRYGHSVHLAWDHPGISTSSHNELILSRPCEFRGELRWASGMVVGMVVGEFRADGSYRTALLDLWICKGRFCPPVDPLISS
jgi:hypothetical protein